MSEWDVDQELSTLVRFVDGFPVKSSTYVEGGHYRVLTIGNVQEGYINWDKYRSIKSLPVKLKSDQVLKHGDILISMTGNVGRVARHDGVPAVLNQRVGKLIPRRVDNNFLYAVLNSPKFRFAMQELAVGGAQGNLSKKSILKFNLPVPRSMQQQSAIGDAIADMSDLVSALERIIVKKQAIKQGMMQQLLTGRTRLPGFSGKWTPPVSVAAVSTRFSGYWGSHPGGSDIDGLVIRAGDVGSDGDLTGSALRGLSNSEAARARCQKGDVILTSSGTVGNVALILRDGLFASNFVRALRPNSAILGRYLFYSLQSERAKAVIASNLGVSAMPNLGSAFYHEPWLELPTLDEQTEIVVILQNLDDEIKALRSRLTKARSIKIGMMQQLLTGRTRLLVEVES